MPGLIQRYSASAEHAALLSTRPHTPARARPLAAARTEAASWYAAAVPPPVAPAAHNVTDDATEPIPPPAVELSLAQRTVLDAGVAPDQHKILRTDPSRMGLLAATRYVLSVRTNVVLVVSSACPFCPLPPPPSPRLR